MSVFKDGNDGPAPAKAKRRNRSRNRQRDRKHVLSVGVLVQAAWLNGRGFPMEDVAARMKVCPKALRTEFSRAGLDKARPLTVEAAPNLELRVALTRDERVTLGTTALDRCLYQPALAGLLLRAVLAQGPAAVDRLLPTTGAAR